MILDLTCSECEASFELDVQDLLNAPKTLECPNCEAKAPARKVETLASAVDDLTRAMKELSSKFSISVTAETDDLVAARASAADGDDDEAEETEEDSDDEADEEEKSESEDADDELEFDR